MSHALKSNTHKAWRPSASLDTLRLRAGILTKIRAFFKARDVWEVDTPLLCETTVTAPYIHSLSVISKGEKFYLQTSPEYAMKRLLAAGSGSIYQLCKAFREDEKGRLHQPEFTILEWYRLGFTHHDLMDDMDDFLQYILNTSPAKRLSYQTLFQDYLGCDPHDISVEKLKEIAAYFSVNVRESEDLNSDDWLQLLMTHVIEPRLNKTMPVFIYDFPVSQAALARIRPGNPPVAERFEVYLNGIELANGYHELSDANEQAKRFEADLAIRAASGSDAIPMDDDLLSALDAGFPDCAGVALGVDRLVMIALQKKHIAEVVAFF